MPVTALDLIDVEYLNIVPFVGPYSCLQRAAGDS